MERYKCLVTFVLIGWMLSITSCNKTHQIHVSNKTEIHSSEIIELESPEEVLIYIGKTWWIRPENARNEAVLTKELLEAKGITVGITGSDEAVRDWMLQTTGNGVVNVCILYGVLPATIYPAGNAQPDGSVAEKWIETTDGDTILNQADYIGYNSSEGKANERGALQNLMDIPEIEINVYEHNLKMIITDVGKTLCPSLKNTASDRPFPLDQFEGEWFAEKILSSDTGNSNGTVADPIIIRDGERGRIAIVYQALNQNNPKVEVVTEIISNYLVVK